MATFVASLDPETQHQAIIQAARRINRGIEVRHEPPLCAKLFRAVQGLNPEDYREFGRQVIAIGRVDYQGLLVRLKQLKLKRLVRCHVYGAPDEVISQSNSVFRLM